MHSAAMKQSGGAKNSAATSGAASYKGRLCRAAPAVSMGTRFPGQRDGPRDPDGQGSHLQGREVTSVPLIYLVWEKLQPTSVSLSRDPPGR